MYCNYTFPASLVIQYKIATLTLYFLFLEKLYIRRYCYLNQTYLKQLGFKHHEKSNKTFPKMEYNRWQRRICALSVQLYSDVTSVNSFMCPTKLLIIVKIKCFVTVK